MAINYVLSGALGTIVEARNSFLHSSDLDRSKPVGWKRQNEFCGEAGVLNDLGMHTWHVPLRLGWVPESVFGVFQNIVTERPGPEGALVECDTWDNVTLHSWARHDGVLFPLTTETKRIDPGQKNTWVFEAIGMDGSVRFSTKNPKSVETFSTIDVPGNGREHAWQQIDAGSQSVWPTVTGAILSSAFPTRYSKCGHRFSPSAKVCSATGSGVSLLTRRQRLMRSIARGSNRGRT
jgi:predicted dehydrogenase